MNVNINTLAYPDWLGMTLSLLFGTTLTGMIGVLIYYLIF